MLVLKSTLRAMRHLHAGPTETRFYLQGVLVEIRKGRGFLAATDGALMGVHSIPVEPDEPDAQYIIPAHMLAQIKAGSARGAPEVVHAAYTDGVVTLQIGAVTISGKAVDGVFPDWRRVMPTQPDDSAERRHFHPDLLARFADAGRDLFGKTSKQCPLFWPSAGGSALVSFDGYAEFRGVVMPRRYRDDCKPVRPSVDAFIGV